MELATPLDVYWSLTQGCNLSCNFCFTSSSPGTTHDDLSQEERARVLQMILDAGVLRVILTGGEPFTIPEIMDIIRTLRAARIGVKITTNGTLLRPPIVQELATLGVRLQFSIESNDPRLSDLAMGGKDTRDRIFGGLKRARDAGIPCDAKVTLQAKTIRKLGPLYEELHALGISKIDVSDVAPMGRAIENWQDLEASLEDLQEASLEAERAVAKGIPVQFGATRLQNKAAGTPALCSLGTPRPRTVLIDERGDVRPCAASQSFGWENNVLEHGLIGAWDRMTLLGDYRNPDNLEGECKTCDLVETCKGGCRGLAFSTWGTLAGPDPYCPKLGEREDRPVYGRKIDPVLFVFPGGSQVSR